jgi:double-stranded uracil-DNA glycosylase
MMSTLVIPNLLKDNLKILFVGINPGLRSAKIGHHFGGYSNRFWRLLADSQLTIERLTPEQDFRLLEYNYGITNIVPRSTAIAAELTRQEFEAGAVLLLTLLQQYRPHIAAYLGKDVYPYLAHKKQTAWGSQKPGMVDQVSDFVLPNPSGLNRMPYSEQLYWYRELKIKLDS